MTGSTSTSTLPTPVGRHGRTNLVDDAAISPDHRPADHHSGRLAHELRHRYLRFRHLEHVSFATGPVDHELTYGGDFLRDRCRDAEPCGRRGRLHAVGRQRQVWGAYIQNKATMTGFESGRCAAF